MNEIIRDSVRRFNALGWINDLLTRVTRGGNN